MGNFPGMFPRAKWEFMKISCFIDFNIWIKWFAFNFVFKYFHKFPKIPQKFPIFPGIPHHFFPLFKFGNFAHHYIVHKVRTCSILKKTNNVAVNYSTIFTRIVCVFLCLQVKNLLSPTHKTKQNIRIFSNRNNYLI